MKRFIEGESRSQQTLMPDCLKTISVLTIPSGSLMPSSRHWICQRWDLTHWLPPLADRDTTRGFSSKSTSTVDLNRIQSSRRLERETGRNVELMWLTGRLSPDFKTIADFRRDNGKGIRNVCRQFVALCRQTRPLQRSHRGH